MQQKSWLLPDGIVELTGTSAQRLERIRRSVLDLYNNWGYSLIFPPLVEYLDSLIAGAGEDLELQTFKLTDQVSGRMLGVRADITPQVARHDAYHNNGDVNRLCYAGSVLHTRPTHILANRSLIQAGAELYGHKGVASDLEILELLLSSLCVADSAKNKSTQGSGDRQNDWTITLGDAGITRALLQQAAVPESNQRPILAALKNKSEPDLIKIAADLQLSSDKIDKLIRLAHLCGNEDTLQAVQQLLPEHAGTCEDLLNIYQTCANNYPHMGWFFDFSSINNYAYESGLLFHATHAQSAEPVARGGRYDHLSTVYGANRPAVGFSCDLLGLALHTQHVQTSDQISHIWAPSFADFTPSDTTSTALLRDKVNELRAKGRSVTTSVHQSAWSNLDSSIQEKYDGYLDFDGTRWQLHKYSSTH